jgi:hypothetical protein
MIGLPLINCLDLFSIPTQKILAVFTEPAPWLALSMIDEPLSDLPRPRHLDPQIHGGVLRSRN